MKELLIVGAHGHGKVVADIAIQSKTYDNLFFFDDNTDIVDVLGYMRKDDIKNIGKELKDKEVIVAIGDAQKRSEILDSIRNQGFKIATLVHPRATIGLEVAIGEGTVVMAGAVINSGTSIGEGTIVNTACSIDHDCIIGDYTHVAVGAHIAGNVYVAEKNWIGAGAVISNNISICSGVTIGAGAVVIKDIIEPGTYVGVPAKKIRDR